MLLIVIWSVTVENICFRQRCSSVIVWTQVLKWQRQQCLLIYSDSEWCILSLLLSVSWIVLIRKMTRKSFFSSIIILIIIYILIKPLFILTLLVVEIIWWEDLSHELSVTIRVCIWISLIVISVILLTLRSVLLLLSMTVLSSLLFSVMIKSVHLLSI